MFLSDTIPPPRPDSPNGLSRNPAGTDDIPFTKPGPFMARIIRFSEVWWEADVPAGQRVYRVLPGTDGSIPRIRISVRFENLYGRIEGRYLELSSKYRASRKPNSVFAQIIAQLAGVDVKLIETPEYDRLDLSTFLDRLVSVTLKAGPGMPPVARINDITPMPIDAKVDNIPQTELNDQASKLIEAQRLHPEIAS